MSDQEFQRQVQQQLQLQALLQAQSDFMIRQQMQTQYQAPWMSFGGVMWAPPDLYIAGTRYDGLTGNLKGRTP